MALQIPVPTPGGQIPASMVVTGNQDSIPRLHTPPTPIVPVIVTSTEVNDLPVGPVTKRLDELSPSITHPDGRPVGDWYDGLTLTKGYPTLMVEDGGNHLSMQYLKYGLHRDEPHIFGTMGPKQPVYAVPLTTLPQPLLLPGNV